MSFYINEIAFKWTKSTLKTVSGRLTFTGLLTNLVSRKNIGSDEGRTTAKVLWRLGWSTMCIEQQKCKLWYKENNYYSGSSDHKDIIRHITDLKTL